MKYLSFMFATVILLMAVAMEYGYDLKVEESAKLAQAQAEIALRDEVIASLNDWYDYMPVPERPYSSPINPDDFRKYTSPFGIRLDPTKRNTGGLAEKDHTGEDIVAETIEGTPDALVISIGIGVVKHKYYSKGWHVISGIKRWFNGHPVFDGYIVIVHPNGDESYYGHLDEIYVHEGETVYVGTKLGRISKKMNGITTGPHLHFALKDKDGVYLPPFRYVDMPREVL